MSCGLTSRKKGSTRRSQEMHPGANDTSICTIPMVMSCRLLNHCRETAFPRKKRTCSLFPLGLVEPPTPRRGLTLGNSASQEQVWAAYAAVLSSWRIGPQYSGVRAYAVNHILRSDRPGSSQLVNTCTCAGSFSGSAFLLSAPARIAIIRYAGRCGFAVHQSPWSPSLMPPDHAVARPGHRPSI